MCSEKGRFMITTWLHALPPVKEKQCQKYKRKKEGKERHPF
jgi:hypothetical protein